MKHLALIALSFFTTAFLAQTGKAPQRPSVTPLIIYDVILYDTAKTENIGYKWTGQPITDYNEYVEHNYLDVNESRIFRAEIKALLKRKDILLWDGWDKIYTPAEAGKKIVREYVVEEIDSVGNLVGPKTIYDSIDTRRWNKVTFYEEWNFNRANGMLEKNALAYLFSWYNDEKGVWIPLFGVLKNKEALERLKKLRSY